MKIIKVFFSIALPSLLSVIPLTHAQPTDPATLRQITQGAIIGTRGRDNAQSWYGIPYAKSPTGSLRFRAPRAPELFQAHPFVATEKANICTQYDQDNTTLIGSENCLFLNVSAPAQSNSQSSLPVMVWVHGAANTAYPFLDNQLATAVNTYCR